LESCLFVCVCVCVFFFFFLTCHILTKTSCIVSATSAAKQYKNLKGSHCQNLWEELTNCTSGVMLETKITFGRQGFAFFRQKFPKISEVKKKEDDFIGPQLFKDQDFSIKLNTTNRRDWKAF
jgi:hypothetical protein